MNRVDRLVNFYIFVLLSVCLVACSDTDSDAANARLGSISLTPSANTIFSTDITAVAYSLPLLESVGFTVASKPGYYSKPVAVTYSASYLREQGLLDEAGGKIRFTVFGLYAGYMNEVKVTLDYLDGVAATHAFTVQTEPFKSEHALPTPDIRILNSDTPVSYMMILSGPRSPIIIDIDGETRWFGPDLGVDVRPTVFEGDAFYVGGSLSNAFFRVAWNGDFQSFTIGQGEFTRSHHNIEQGKYGLINTIGYDDGVNIQPESVAIEISRSGEVLRTWDLDEIVGEFIRAAGEDPKIMIRNDFDWCHMNSANYDAANNAVLMSCREGFVISVDYDTNEINWLLGNPQKLWYTAYPNSLQTLALTVSGNPPIGQHSLSMLNDGKDLLLFNNGFGNLQLPYVEDNRDHALVSVYRINQDAMTADVIWEFDNNRELQSDICSSAYRTRSSDTIINYAATNDDWSVARLQVVSNDFEILYDAAVTQRPQDRNSCATVYSADEIPLDALLIH